VKLEGKKSMDIVSFVNGNKEVVWYCFWEKKLKSL
jgi:hypothetical protein